MDAFGNAAILGIVETRVGDLQAGDGGANGRNLRRKARFNRANSHTPGADVLTLAAAQTHPKHPTVRQRAAHALTGEDESAIRGLLELYGKNDSLGYFATRRDKSVVFAHSGRAAVTYRVEVGVCLASGDPVGDPRAWPQAIGAWLALCQTYGWAPGVMGASSQAAQAYREAGLNALELVSKSLDGSIAQARPNILDYLFHEFQ